MHIIMIILVCELFNDLPYFIYSCEPYGQLHNMNMRNCIGMKVICISQVKCTDACRHPHAQMHTCTHTERYRRMHAWMDAHIMILFRYIIAADN